jgi:hypothetical protein
MDEIRMNFDDPRVWARCDSCCKKVDDKGQSQYFGKAYSDRKWKKGPACDNCGGPMTELYRLRGDRAS